MYHHVCLRSLIHYRSHTLTSHSHTFSQSYIRPRKVHMQQIGGAGLPHPAPPEIRPHPAPGLALTVGARPKSATSAIQSPHMA